MFLFEKVVQGESGLLQLQGIHATGRERVRQGKDGKVVPLFRHLPLKGEHILNVPG